jgi:membrane-associated protein
MDTSSIIEWGGIALIAVLIFAETGLLLGLIIPGGETLVFTSGLLVSTGVLDLNVVLLLTTLSAAGFVGDVSGYTIGRKYGGRLLERKDKWYFKKKYLQAVEQFFQRHKRRTIIIGKFVPVVRPFVPVTAGISRMKNVMFVFLSLVSVVIYMSAFVLAGYFLGNRFPEIKNYLHWILPITVIVLVVPVIIKIRKEANATSPRETQPPAP